MRLPSAEESVFREVQKRAKPIHLVLARPFVKEMLFVNSLGVRDGGTTHDPERKSRTARTAEATGDQVWTRGFEGQDNEDVGNNPLAAPQRTTRRAAGADRTPPYQGHLAKAEKNENRTSGSAQKERRGRKPRSSQCKASAQLVATADNPRRAFVLRTPDGQTLAFWRATADYPHEVAARIAKFSRAVGEKAVTKAAQSEHRWRDAATAERSRRSDARGRVLVMPKHPDLGSRSSSQAHERNIGSYKGGNMKAPGSRAKKTGTKLKRGLATQIMCYPRLKTKAVLVQASRDVNRPLSSFMIMASLRAAAALQGREVTDLIPQTELRQYLREK